MKGERLASTPISPRQRQVLDLVRDLFAGSMPGTRAAYRRIATAIGWKNYTSVKPALFVLRAKGAVRSVGGTMTSPERWEVVT